MSHDVEPVIHGDVPEPMRAYALDKIGRVGRSAPRPVLYARVDLAQDANPTVQRPARAKATLDVSGTIVQAHVAAPKLDDAIDRLEYRLRRRLERLAERRADRRRETGVAEPGEWRHGDLPTDRPEYFPRAPEEREIVRQKAFPLPPLSVEEAAFEMDLLGHEFFLYRDLATDDDALVQLAGDPPHEPVATFAAESPTLTLADAIARLDVAGDRFVFFRDATTGRGTVLYRRYDGHYGLIAPADGPAVGLEPEPAPTA